MSFQFNGGSFEYEMCETLGSMDDPATVAHTADVVVFAPAGINDVLNDQIFGLDVFTSAARRGERMWLYREFTHVARDGALLNGEGEFHDGRAISRWSAEHLHAAAAAAAAGALLVPLMAGSYDGIAAHALHHESGGYHFMDQVWCKLKLVETSVA